MYPAYVLKPGKTAHSVCYPTEVFSESLLLGHDDGSVGLWSLRDYKNELCSVHAGDSPCLSLKMMGTTLFTHEKKGTIKTWQMKESAWEEISSIKCDYMGFSQIDVTACMGGLLACPVGKGKVEVYSCKDQEKIFSFEGTDKGEVMSLKLITVKDKPHLLIAYECGELLLVSCHNGRVASTLKDDKRLLSLDFDSSCMRGALGSTANQVESFKIIGDELEKESTVNFTFEGASVVKIFRSADTLLIGTWVGSAYVFRWSNMKPLKPHVLLEHSGTILDIACSSHHKLCVSIAGDDSKVSLWSLL